MQVKGPCSLHWTYSFVWNVFPCSGFYVHFFLLKHLHYMACGETKAVSVSGKEGKGSFHLRQEGFM
jgi:hypothetical protein